MLLFVCERVCNAPRAESTELEEDLPPESSGNRALGWLHTIWRHAKFWIALALTICMQLLLTWAFICLNPFVRLFPLENVGMKSTS